MILLALRALGRLIALTPEAVLRALSIAGGELILWIAPRRRRLLRSNLHHAFPEKPRAWRRGVARESSRQLIETAMLSMAAPFLSDRRIREIATLGPSAEAFARDAVKNQRPTVFATLHLALWEAQTWYTFLTPVPLPEFGVFFRPLDNEAANTFVKHSRERHGMRLLSRRDGLAQALGVLRKNGCVAVLFDQNAGDQGALTLVLGRVCSSTELPGILAAKFGADLRTFYPKRTAFWRVQYETEAVPYKDTPAAATLALNRWFEAAMQDEALCRSWLWAHDRWRNQDVPARRLRLEAKRNFLAEDLSERGLAQMPRKTRVWIRIPNWLGDVVMAIPLIRAIRQSRPDAEITLLCKAAFIPLLERLGIADRMIALPSQGIGYFSPFASLRAHYPDTWILLTNSTRGDLEARVAGCPQRFGIRRPGKSRMFLTKAYPLPLDYDESAHHQVELWGDFLRHFGLAAQPDFTPFPSTLFAPAAAQSGNPIGLIAGSENMPSKRWPVAHWRTLIESFPSERFVLFGTAADAALTAEISRGFGAGRVTDMAGKTSLCDFAAGLAACRLLVSNDTGGMHLANALGVPVVVLFGPTNPVRTGPVFAGPKVLLLPPGSQPTGGASLQDLSPQAVIAAVRDLP
ncbi:MAG TPA: glycosyltransferase family 9 protein [Opitutaceae bacterium]|nr:glycosyltransferase family 9 protein [Opitutaceae bacterium]